MKLMFVTIAALVAGPTMAWLLVFAGCSGVSPALGSLCGHNSYIPLAGFTLLAWLVLAALVALKSPGKS